MKNIFDYQKREHKNVDYYQLLEHIYFKNRNKQKIFVEAASLKSTKDLFRFCLDLFCKGLVLCYGDESRKVTIDSLSLEQIQDVIDKLSYTGIMTIIQVLQKDMEAEDHASNAEESSYSILTESVKRIDEYPDNGDLKEYNFKIKVGPTVFCIFFDIRI